jgi:transforming growth factor-beta-induced protein
MKNLSLLLIGAIFMTSLFTSCDDDTVVPAPEPEPTSVVDIALSDENFSMLVDAVSKAGLVSALDDPTARYTVFAPTNAAFTQLMADLGINSIDEVPLETLTNILLFHVINGTVESTDLSTGYTKTLNTQGPDGTSPDLRIVVDGGVTLNGGSTVTDADYRADNGVVHVIDKVMMPPTIVDLAISNDAFTSLVAALTAGDNTTDFVSTLTGDGPFTVFAPVDAAFQSLLDSSPDWNALTDIPVEVRDAVLKYHVVNEANVRAADLTDEQEVTTLSGGTFSIDLDNGAQIRTTAGQTVNIVITDVQGINGIIHVVDTVLLP